jgi:homoserine kinase
VAHRMPLDDDLTFVLIVPDRVLTTSEARASLGATVAFRDATFNLGRLGLLLAGLADHRHLCPSAMDDRLHQTVRTVLFPEAPKLLEALLDAGAMASCWSGAGPSLLGVCLADTANQVARAARERLGDLGLPGSVYTLRPDHDGVTLVADD